MSWTSHRASSRSWSLGLPKNSLEITALGPAMALRPCQGQWVDSGEAQRSFGTTSRKNLGSVLGAVAVGQVWEELSGWSREQDFVRYVEGRISLENRYEMCDGAVDELGGTLEARKSLWDKSGNKELSGKR